MIRIESTMSLRNFLCFFIAIKYIIYIYIYMLAQLKFGLSQHYLQYYTIFGVRNCVIIFIDNPIVQKHRIYLLQFKTPHVILCGKER